MTCSKATPLTCSSTPSPSPYVGKTTVELQIAITPHSVVAKRTADRTAKINDAISEANGSPDHDCD
jgi:hypothetical protein